MSFKIGDRVRLREAVISPTADFSQDFGDLKRIPAGTEAVVEYVEDNDVFVTFPGEPLDGWSIHYFELAE